MSFQKAIVITALGKRPTAIQMADVPEDGFFNDGGVARKRRRLTHLSADEKIMRRKLKNRVAAQTARDRKKALMQELEEKVALLQEENKQLLKENAELRLNQTAIQKENEYLKSASKVSSLPAPAPIPCKVEPEPDCPALPCKTEPECPGSAEGTDSSSVSCDDALRSLCPDFKSDALLHFLEEFCGEGGEFIQPETEAGEASTTPLSQLGVTGAVVGEVSSEACMVGSPSANMDSINELIQSDHQYYKEEPKPVHTPFSSNTTSTSLLDGRRVITTLPPNTLPDLSTQPTLQSGHTVSSTSTQRSVGAATVARGRTCKLGSFTSGSASNKMSVVTMVDPNMVYSPRPRIAEPSPVDTDVPDTDDSGFLSADMLESLDGLLSLEDLPDFSLLDQKTKPQKIQQTVITPSSPSSGAGTGRKTSQRRQNSPTTPRAKAQQPAISNISSGKIQGLQSFPYKTECPDGYRSPESGFVSDCSEGSSYLSDSSPSPDSLGSPDIESLSWQEDFVSVSMDLFPDVGLCV